MGETDLEGERGHLVSLLTNFFPLSSKMLYLICSFFLMILNKYSLCRRHEQKKRKSWAKMLRLLHFFSPWHSIPLLLPLFDPVVLHQLRLYLRKENGKWKTGRDLTRFLVIFFFLLFLGWKNHLLRDIFSQQLPWTNLQSGSWCQSPIFSFTPSDLALTRLTAVVK